MKQHNQVQDIWLQWEQITQQGELYTPRTGHTIAVINDHVYLFSGIDENDRQNDLYSFNIEKQNWNKIQSKGDIPTARSGSTFIQMKGHLLLFGGYTRKNGEYFNDLYNFDPKQNSWQLLQSKNPPPPRIDYILLKYDDSKAYLFGGSNGYKRTNDIHELNLQTYEWKQIKAQKNPSSLTNLNSNNSKNNLSQQQLQQQQQLIKKSDMLPSARFGHSGVIYQNNIYIFGGWDGQQTLNDLWKFDFQTQTWEEIQQKCKIGSRYRHCAVLHNQLMFVFGGVDQKQARFGDLNYYDFERNIWKLILLGQEGPSSRSFHRSIISDSELYILGGFDGLRRNDMFKINLEFVSIQEQTNLINEISNEKMRDKLIPKVTPQKSQKEYAALMKQIKKNSGQKFFEYEDGEDYLNSNGSSNKIPDINIQDNNIQQFNNLPLQRWFYLPRNEDENEYFSPRTGHSVVQAQDNIYVFGGIDQEGKRNNDLYKYNITDNKMVKVVPKNPSKMPSQRTGAKCVTMKNDLKQKLLVFFGGYINKDQEHCNDLYTFNTETLEWDIIIPEKESENIEKRTDHSMVKYCKNIYVFGGRGENKSFCKDLMRFSTKKKVWKLIETEGEQIIRRFGHISVIFENSMYVFGGWDGQMCLDDLYEYSFTSNIFREIRKTEGKKPFSRYRHEGLVFNNSLYISGGVDQNQQRYNDIHQFNFQNNTWTQIFTSGCLPSPRTFHKFVNYQNLFFIFGGYDGERKNDIYKIVFQPNNSQYFNDAQSLNSYQSSNQRDNISIISGLEREGKANTSESRLIKMLTDQIKELSLKLLKEEERTLCRICFSREINAIILDCKHHAVCFECCNGLKQCPLCREKIDKVIKTFAP